MLACTSLLLAAALVQAPMTATFEQRLVASPPSPTAAFGAEIAIDGDRAAVGASKTFSSGEVHVFERAGGTWILAQRIDCPAGGHQALFGAALALEGDRLAVGAPRWTQSGVFAGRVFLYEFDGVAWTLADELGPVTAANAELFGQAVSLSGDTLAVGRPNYDLPMIEAGLVHVFVHDANGWTEQASLQASDAGAVDRFGGDVVLQGDRLAVGASGDDDGANDSGAAYVFERSGTSWTEIDKLKPADPSSAQFFAEHLQLEGDRVAIGARGDDHAGFNTGAAYVFELVGGAWQQTQKLLAATPVATDGFGISLSLEGDLLAIGAWQDSQGASLSGATYLFRRHSGNWTQAVKIKAHDGLFNDCLGVSCALEGSTLMTGVLRDDEGAVDGGSVYVYRVAVEPVVYCTAQTSSLGCAPTIAHSGFPSATELVPFEVFATNVVNQKGGLLFYGTFGRDQTPFSGGTLCVQGPVRRTPAQSSGGSALGADCTGELRYDFNARIRSGVDPALVVGAIVDAQYWHRDPQAPDKTCLSDALEFEIGD
jgi:hypothetical protein